MKETKKKRNEKKELLRNMYVRLYSIYSISCCFSFCIVLCYILYSYTYTNIIYLPYMFVYL